MSVSFDVSASADINPYVFGAGWDNTAGHFNGNWKIQSGVLRPASIDILTARIISSPATTGTLRMKIAVGHASASTADDNDGIVFLTPAGNGYAILFKKNIVQVFIITAFVVATGVGTAYTFTSAFSAGELFTGDFVISSGTINLYRDSSSLVTPIMTSTGLTYVSGMAEGIAGIFSDSNSAGVISANNATPGSVSIDSITTAGSSGLKVGSAFAITTTGLGTLAEIDIQTLGLLGSTVLATSISAPSGDGTAVMPPWVNGQKYPKPGTVFVSAYDSVPNHADLSVTLSLPDNYINATFSSVVLTDSTYLGFGLNVIGHPLADGDMGYWPNVNSLTFGANGKISVDLPESSTMTSDLWIQKVDGTMQYYSVTINDAGYVIPVVPVASSGGFNSLPHTTLYIQ